MEPAQILQIIVTIVVILGAAAVALVCDMLKSNNERLRQENAELQVRREEERRRADLALRQLKAVTAGMRREVHGFKEPGSDRGAGEPQAQPSRPRRNWDLLIRTARTRRRQVAASGANPIYIGGKLRGELIPFESLNGGQEHRSEPQRWVV